MHIYAFGSICRGDLSVESDIDLLALVKGRDPRVNQELFSIYSYQRIKELWEAGNAFAWHLALESKLIYSEDGKDYLHSLGMPSPYVDALKDCERFRDIFDSSLASVKNGTPSLVFELSTIFLAVRNIATCYSLAKMPNPTFGRDSARRLGTKSIPMSDNIYSLLMRARLLSTRALGEDIGEVDIPKVALGLERCHSWVNEICEEVAFNG